MVAILTAVMRKSLRVAAAFLLAVTPVCASAQKWSIGVATGPFVFGKLAERTSAIGTEVGSSTITSRLSAQTRPGISADVERDFGRWLGVRLDASWTYAPLRVKQPGGGGTTSDAGHLGVTTLAAPLVINLNRGDFRVHLMGGPAYALYHGNRRGTSGNSFTLFEGTRGRLGGVAGAGVAWWWSDRFGVEGEIADIVTASPFHIEDIAPTSKGVHIPRTQNVHTTVGLRWRF
jgi:hypothetical protein